MRCAIPPAELDFTAKTELDRLAWKKYKCYFSELAPDERKIIWQKYRKAELKYMTRQSAREYWKRQILEFIREIKRRILK